MSKEMEAARNATELLSWNDPWEASIHQTEDGRIVYLSNGWDSEIYPSRQAAIEAQSQWLPYADSKTVEERTWAEMAQNILDALA